MSAYWKSKDQIILREISQGKIWTVRPVTIIEDTDQTTVCYMQPGTIYKHPREHESDNTPTHLIANDWRLVDKTWFGGGALYLSKPDEPYMVIGFRNEENTSFERWYINLQNPFIRTSFGFDYLDMELDIEIDGSLSTWHWKDEDKFNHLMEQGVIPANKANYLKEIGKSVASNLMQNPSMIEPWRTWTPPPDITIPQLPIGWENT